MNCRFCGTPLTFEFVDLGESPPSNSYLTRAQLNEKESYFPLKLFVCEKCFLVQIDEHKKAEEIFSKDYAYFSSFSTSWLQHSKRYVEMATSRFGLDPSSLVIEIASNDGYLLQYFLEKAIPVLGIEPTTSTAKVAIDKGIDTLTEFFGVGLAERLAQEGRRADLLLGNNVLAHVPDINDFVAGLKVALKASGVVTMEFPHLLQLVNLNQFDTIYHEHFSYLSFTTVSRIFAAHGLRIFDVEELTTHGGSLRVFATHQESDVSIQNNVAVLLEKERAAGIEGLGFYKGFQSRVDKVKNEMLRFLNEAKREGKKVAAYGAAAKGNTLLNYCGIDSSLIDFVVDASPYKQGKLLPGSHIPIVAEAEILATRPDYIVILPWNIKEEIMAQVEYVRKWNCKFVCAIPQLQLM